MIQRKRRGINRRCPQIGFDPFGDFELLFSASELALGIVDLPIRYLERKYGSTNISRFRDGWLLLRMTVYGFFRLRLGRLK